MPNLLIAPLDWGLGHATRIIPVIRFLQNAGCTVIIAAEGFQQELLQQEFPTLQFISLKGYRISYTTNKRWFALKILLQLPKVLSIIRREHAWLQKIIASEKIDIVISDNRYGLYTNKIPCVFITHQLQIIAPFLWMERLMQKINYSYINCFTECWVPDFEGSINIAGRLSHPAKLPKIKLQYIGALSRLKIENTTEKKYHWLIILSGPEPQRSVLEKKLLSVIPKLKSNTLLVRGKPGSEEKISSFSNCTVANHLTATQMQQAFAESEYIISRSGYTTVMDILLLQKKSILIPTPGQTEQEYLAKHLMQQQWCYTFQQDDENILIHLKNAEEFHFKFPSFAENVLENVVNNFLIQHT